MTLIHKSLNWDIVPKSFVQGIVEIMEDFETLNDTVNSIETNVDEIGTKVANNANALVEVNITITNFLSKKKKRISLCFFNA